MKLSCNKCRSLTISFEELYRCSDTSTSIRQWGCVKAVSFILLIMVIMGPMKLEKVNGKITASWWTNISPKQYSRILNLTNKKNEDLLGSKRDCVSWLSSHFLLQPITRPCMIRHGTWEREWENHSIESNKICLPSLSDIKRYKQLKLNFDKISKNHNCNPFESSSSLSIPSSSVIAVLFLPASSSFTKTLQWCKSNKPFHTFFFFFQLLTWTSSGENPSTPPKRAP